MVSVVVVSVVVVSVVVVSVVVSVVVVVGGRVASHGPESMRERQNSPWV